jgi:hypothetical protein
MTISYFEIIRLAVLSCKPDPSRAELKELHYGLSEIGDAALRLVVMARKLMKGKPFRVTSNNPELLREYRAIGKALGAQINVVEPTELHFTPRLPQ